MEDTPKRRPRLGIYGGTFAPPHRGHVQAAWEFLTQAELDTLLIMPAAVPPHKRIDEADDPSLRLAMCHAAFDRIDPRLRVSDYEIRRGGTSYTYQTLTHYAETTDAELFFLCGTDMFLSLDCWRNPEIIFALATVACVMREDDGAVRQKIERAASDFLAKYDARTLLLETAPIPLSSTEIRESVGHGSDITNQVPVQVAELIRRHGLYRKTTEEYKDNTENEGNTRGGDHPGDALCTAGADQALSER